MKTKNLIALLLIVLLSSCSNLLHVEKRQYRKGFHIDNFLTLNKQKNVLLSVKDTAIRQVYSQNNNIINKEDAMREDVVVLADNDSLFVETSVETIHSLPIADIPNIEKIKDEDPDNDDKVKPNAFDIISSILGLLSVVSFCAFWFTIYFWDLSSIVAGISFNIFIVAVPLTILSFLIGRIIDLIQNKEKNKQWNKRAWVSFILTIITIALLILILVIG
jgi:hypothetical protein